MIVVDHYFSLPTTVNISRYGGCQRGLLRASTTGEIFKKGTYLWDTMNHIFGLNRVAQQVGHDKAQDGMAKDN